MNKYVVAVADVDEGEDIVMEVIEAPDEVIALTMHSKLSDWIATTSDIHTVEAYREAAIDAGYTLGVLEL